MEVLCEKQEIIFSFGSGFAREGGSVECIPNTFQLHQGVMHTAE